MPMWNPFRRNQSNRSASAPQHNSEPTEVPVPDPAAASDADMTAVEAASNQGDAAASQTETTNSDAEQPGQSEHPHTDSATDSTTESSTESTADFSDPFEAERSIALFHTVTHHAGLTLDATPEGVVAHLPFGDLPLRPVEDIVAAERELTRAMLTDYLPNISDADFYRLLRVQLVSNPKAIRALGIESIAGEELRAGERFPAHVESKEFPVRPWSDQLVIMLAVYHEGILVYLTPDVLRDRDELDILWKVAYRNTWEELAASDIHAYPMAPKDTPAMRVGDGEEQSTTLETSQHQGLWHLTGSSRLVSAGALFIDDIVQQLIPNFDLDGGFLLAVPRERSIVIAPIQEGAEAAAALGTMIASTMEHYLGVYSREVHGEHATPETSGDSGMPNPETAALAWGRRVLRGVEVLHDGVIDSVHLRNEDSDGGPQDSTFVKIEVAPPAYLLERMRVGMEPPRDGEDQADQGDDAQDNRDSPNDDDGPDTQDRR